MLWIRNVRNGGNTDTKCVGNNEGKGLIGRPGADWRIPLKPLREICCYMDSMAEFYAYGDRHSSGSILYMKPLDQLSNFRPCTTVLVAKYEKIGASHNRETSSGTLNSMAAS